MTINEILFRKTNRLLTQYLLHLYLHISSVCLTCLTAEALCSAALSCSVNCTTSCCFRSKSRVSACSFSRLDADRRDTAWHKKGFQCMYTHVFNNDYALNRNYSTSKLVGAWIVQENQITAAIKAPLACAASVLERKKGCHTWLCMCSTCSAAEAFCSADRSCSFTAFSLSTAAASCPERSCMQYIDKIFLPLHSPTSYAHLQYTVLSTCLSEEAFCSAALSCSVNRTTSCCLRSKSAVKVCSFLRAVASSVDSSYIA